MHREKICLWQRWRNGWDPFWHMTLNKCDTCERTFSFDDLFTRWNEKILPTENSFLPSIPIACLIVLNFWSRNLVFETCPVFLAWDHECIADLLVITIYVYLFSFLVLHSSWAAGCRVRCGSCKALLSQGRLLKSGAVEQNLTYVKHLNVFWQSGCRNTAWFYCQVSKAFILSDQKQLKYKRFRFFKLCSMFRSCHWEHMLFSLD